MQALLPTTSLPISANGSLPAHLTYAAYIWSAAHVSDTVRFLAEADHFIVFCHDEKSRD
jgi:hypothetical protein